MENVYSFGYWVMRRRKALDLTRAGLAQRISCSPETIKKIERDERRPSRQVATLLADALGVPGTEQELFLQAALGKHPVDSLPSIDRSPSSLSTPHNLPLQPTAFIGREAELVTLGLYLAEPDTRLITILGPGGMGKTRLALAAAEAQLRDFNCPFPSGVYFASLTSVDAPEQLLSAIAEALDFRFYQGGEPKEQLLYYLRHKRLLLVLDNFEHLRAAAGLVDEMLAAAPGLKALITSREKLNRQAEQVFLISGLSLPDSANGDETAGEDWTMNEAVRLFAQSARRVRPDFALTFENRRPVIDLCRLVGGAPLGIVLAASWLGTLSVAEVVVEMRRSLDFAAVEMADVPERQRSLRAAFNHSWRLLTEAERKIFRRLSVFHGGFDRAAAEAVAGASPRDLQSLVNKSLLARTGQRYEVHELLRQFAAERLSASSDEEIAVRDSHSAHYCAFLQGQTENWHNLQQMESLAAVTHEEDNARAATQWSLERRAWSQLGRALDSWATYSHRQWRLTEGISLCRAIAVEAEVWDKSGEIVSDDLLRLWASALAWASVFNLDEDNYETALRDARQSLALLDRLELVGQDIRRERAFAHLAWGRIPGGYESLDEWRQHLEQSLALYRELGELWGVAECLRQLGDLAWWVDIHLLAGLQELQSAYDIQLEIGDRWAQSGSITQLALVRKHLGYLDEAVRLHREALRLSHELGQRQFLSQRHAYLAWALCWQVQDEESLNQAWQGVARAQDMGQPDAELFAHCAISYTLMHAGKSEEARRHLAKALSELGEALVGTGRGALYMVLGELALTESAYAEGQECFAESIVTYEIFAKHLIGWSLSELALADYHLHLLSSGRRHLAEALALALTGQDYWSALISLPVAALLLAASGDVVHAVEVWALAQNNPFIAHSRYYEDLAGREVGNAAVSLPQEVAEAAKERGRALDMWATAAELLAFLEDKN